MEGEETVREGGRIIEGNERFHCNNTPRKA